MTTFALIHGANSAGFYWDRVVPRLIDAGHTVVAPDLPAGDPDADFIAYADAVDAALEKVPGCAGDLDVIGGQRIERADPSRRRGDSRRRVATESGRVHPSRPFANAGRT